MARRQNIIWIDVESTGIDANHERLLQVACRITNHDLEILDGEGYEAKVHYSPEEVERMKRTTSEFVVEMHTKTGLWDQLHTEGIALEAMEEGLLAHIKQYVPEARKARLAGNSITLDRNFINTYLPAVGEHLHYRSYDVSSIAGMVEMYMGGGKMYRKDSTHEAMDDITESIKEMAHYQKLLFPDYSGLLEDDSSQ